MWGITVHRADTGENITDSVAVLENIDGGLPPDAVGRRHLRRRCAGPSEPSGSAGPISSLEGLSDGVATVCLAQILDHFREWGPTDLAADAIQRLIANGIESRLTFMFHTPDGPAVTAVYSPGDKPRPFSITIRHATPEECAALADGDANTTDGAAAIVIDGRVVAIHNEYGTLVYPPHIESAAYENLVELAMDLYTEHMPPGEDRCLT